MATELKILPLTRADFAEFGDVIESPDAGGQMTNAGLAVRHDDVAQLESPPGTLPRLGIFRVKPTPLPIEVTWLECHPLASQAFVPIGERTFLVIVAPGGPEPDPAKTRCFMTNGRQGVNYRRGTWHYPIVALDRDTDFMVIDRGDAGGNFAQSDLAGGAVLSVKLPG